MCQISKLSGFLLLVAAPLGAQADLVYENVGGTGLIYDATDNTTFTQNADISGTTYTFQGARTWAAGLNVPGINAIWELPTGAQFRSLFLQLDGTADKYGSQVSFGVGANDYASNVQPEYWTSSPGIDFNFYYGFPGSQPNSNLYAGWAVETAPEPDSALMGGVAFALLAGVLRLRRHTAQA